MKRTEAIKAFRKVAQEYFDTTNKHRKITNGIDNTFHNGICYALNRTAEIDGYLLMNFCLEELGYPDGELETHYDDNRYLSDWEDRAYLCLLLAKMLEDGTIKFSNFKDYK